MIEVYFTILGISVAVGLTANHIPDVHKFITEQLKKPSLVSKDKAKELLEEMFGKPSNEKFSFPNRPLRPRPPASHIPSQLTKALKIKYQVPVNPIRTAFENHQKILTDNIATRACVESVKITAEIGTTSRKISWTSLDGTKLYTHIDMSHEDHLTPALVNTLVIERAVDAIRQAENDRKDKQQRTKLNAAMKTRKPRAKSLVKK